MPTSSDSLPIRPARTITFETTEGTFLNVDLSPDGRTIVFDLLGDLYTVPIDGGAAAQLTRGLSWDRYPVWSPDGRQIAYVSDGTGSDQLWVMHADGTQRRSITARQQESLMPPFTTIAWTPDGASLVSGDSVYSLAGGTRPLPAPLTGPVRFSPDGRYVDYVRDGVRRYDQRTGTSVQLAHPPVPTLMRPVVSPDGRWLAYIAGDASNSRDMTRADGLRVRNLETGDDRWLAYPLGRRFRCECLPHQWPMYERYVFTPDSKAILIAFGGKLHRLDVATGRDDTIPFTATVNVDLGPFAYHQYRLPNDSLTVRYLRTPDVSPDGTALVFSALRRLYTMALPAGTPRPLLKSSERDAPGQFHPAYSPDGKWVAYVTWSDHEGGHVWRVPAKGGQPQRLTAVAAYYRRPAWSPDGTTLAIIASDRSAVDREAPTRVPRDGVLQLLPSTGGTPRTIMDGVSSDGPVAFAADGEHVLVQDITAALVSVRLDGRERRTLARASSSRPGTQIVASPDGRYAAYLLGEEVYLARLPELADSVVLDDSTDAVPIVRLSHHGGVDPRWERGGESLTWIFGNRFYRVDPALAMAAAGHEAAHPIEQGTRIPLTVPRAIGQGTVALRGGRVITMRGTEVIEDATLVITDGRITAVGPAGTVRVPPGAKVIDVEGRTIMPGLIDLHAHFAAPPPDAAVGDWRLAINLAYGVTTARDPSGDAEQFGYAELIETGQLLGPRLFSVGRSLNPSKVDIESLADARAVVQQRQAMGTIVIKQYAQPTRRQRQWILQAAHEAGLNVTNEGASDTPMELTMVLDGFAGVEHNLPDADLYEDITRLIAEAKTWYTPVLQAVYPAYGPLSGAQYFLDRYRLHDDPKYRRFAPPLVIGFLRDGYRQAATEDRFFLAVSRQAAAIRHLGGRVALGSHGNDQAIGVHWELWALQMGGLTNHEALQAATIVGAAGLGLQRDLGSLEVGKIADLLVLDRNPLENIEHSLTIRYVMKNGILYDGATLNMLWPTPRQRPAWMSFQAEVR